MGLFDRLKRSDEDRLTDEVREWAESVPGTERIAACPSREPVRISGVVRRLTLRPSDGSVSLEAEVNDGTGSVIAQWIGRDGIEGLELGRQVILKGVLGKAKERGRLRMVNPDFEFA